MDAVSFAFGFASWPVLIYTVLFILLTVEIAYDAGLLALTTLVIAAIAGTLMGWFSLGWVVHHWDQALLLALVYVPIGVVWAVVKWWFFVRAEARALVDRIGLASDTAKKWGRDEAEVLVNIPRRAPQVREHKTEIMRWMGWWPFSLVATLLNDPFRRMFEALYRWLGTFLQQMSDRAFAHLQLPGDINAKPDAFRVDR